MLPMRMRSDHFPSVHVWMRPECPTCGTLTMLTTVYPDKPGYHEQTFVCVTCDYVEKVVAKLDFSPSLIPKPGVV